MAQGRASRLINDLSHVPNIVGGLGLSIAAAQKAFNLDYINNIERLIVMAKSMLGEKKLDATTKKAADLTAEEKAQFDQMKSLVMDLLAACAPPRYQYTETTLGVRMDLAQTMDVSGTVGLGVGFGGVTLNAAFTVGYGFDYRASAECKTVIHAIPADKTVMQGLLDRAKAFADKALEMPVGATVDDRVFTAASAAFEKMTGFLPAPVTRATPDSEDPPATK